MDDLAIGLSSGGGGGDDVSELLRFLEHEVQIVALSFMVIAYSARLLWMFRFRAQQELAIPAGDARRGIVRAMMTAVVPLMPRSAKDTVLYVQFAVFHVGIAAGIAATFIIPYWPELFEIRAIVILFQVLLLAAAVAGIMRLIRRMRVPALRIINTPDDYCSLIFVILFLGVGVYAVPNTYHVSETPLIVFFSMTALLLIYVPFSKISHYLYYPFTSYFLGKTMGHRGVLLRKKEGRHVPAGLEHNRYVHGRENK